VINGSPISFVLFELDPLLITRPTTPLLDPKQPRTKMKKFTFIFITFNVICVGYKKEIKFYYPHTFGVSSERL
jgi:hypothetical protein